MQDQDTPLQLTGLATRLKLSNTRGLAPLVRYALAGALGIASFALTIPIAMVAETLIVSAPLVAAAAVAWYLGFRPAAFLVLVTTALLGWAASDDLLISSASEYDDLVRAGLFPFWALFLAYLSDAAWHSLESSTVLAAENAKLLADSQRSQAEALSSAKFLRSITTNMSVGLLMMDGEGRIRFMNPEAEEITGYRLEDVEGEIAHDKVHYLYPDGRPFPQSECPIDSANSEVKSGRGFSDIFVRPDGTFYHVLCNFAPLSQDDEISGMIIDFQDVSAMKEAEQAMAESRAALQESEGRFRFMADHSPAMIWQAGTDGGLLYIGRSYLEATGLEPEAVLGGRWIEQVHPEDAQPFARIYEKALERSEPFKAEYRLRHHDGTYRWAVNHGTPNLTATGSLVGFLGSILDIHEEREAEEKLRAANALKDEFLGLVSHELRTPVTTILGNALLLARRNDRLEADDRQQIYEDLATEALRLQEDVENLLLLTRLDGSDLDLQPLDLELIISNVLATFKSRNPSHPVLVNIQSGVRKGLGQENMVSMILQNLLSNAQKYSPPGTPIVIGLHEEDSQLRVVVEDQGIGLDEDDLARLFSLFYRSDRAQELGPGMGLGLTVCKRILEALGGSILANSRPEGGARFSFTLQAAEEAAET
jgi:PAS domain S-box-containing protein